jgi:hypothetical protein
MRLVGGQRRGELGRDVLGQLADVGGLGAQLERSGLQAREVQQLGGELAQAVDLLAQLGQEGGACLLVELLVLEQLQEAAEREDRRAQLVRRGGDEAPPRGLELGELALHGVERAGELAELVARAGLEARPEVALGHAPRGVLHPPHPAAEGLREQVAGEQRAEQRERAGDEHALADERRRGVDVLQRRRVDGDVVDPGLLRSRRREPQGQRRLGHAADVARLGPARHPPGARRLEGHGELQVADLALGGRVRGEVGLRPLGPAREAEQGDARARRVGRLAHALVEDLARERVLERVDDRARVLARDPAEGVELLVAHAGLQARGDAQVDAGDHHQRDGEEQQREAVGERSQLGLHYDSVSRKR